MTNFPSITNHRPELDDKLSKEDILAISLKAVSGLAPIPGLSSIVDLLTLRIPNQKSERLADYVKHLHDRINTLDDFRIASSITEDQVISIVELSVQQALESQSSSRRKLIAQFLTNSLSIEEIYSENKCRLLEIFGRLSNIELILLQEANLYETERSEFDEFHTALWNACDAPFDAPVLGYSGETMLGEYYDNLGRMGLIDEQRRNTKLGELLATVVGMHKETRSPGEFKGEWHGLVAEMNFPAVYE